MPSGALTLGWTPRTGSADWTEGSRAAQRVARSSGGRLQRSCTAPRVTSVRVSAAKSRDGSSWLQAPESWAARKADSLARTARHIVTASAVRSTSEDAIARSPDRCDARSTPGACPWQTLALTWRSTRRLPLTTRSQRARSTTPGSPSRRDPMRPAERGGLRRSRDPRRLHRRPRHVRCGPRDEHRSAASSHVDCRTGSRTPALAVRSRTRRDPMRPAERGGAKGSALLRWLVARLPTAQPRAGAEASVEIGRGS